MRMLPRRSVPRGAVAASVALVAGAVLVAAARPAPGAVRTPVAQPDSTRPRVSATNDSVAGAYLTVVGGCNDCHTANWDQTMGKTPEADRLAGSNVGYRGPWGTTYAANLRLVASRASEDRWVEILTTADGGHGKPPMPWQNTAQTSDADLRAIYRYLKALGPTGERTPRAVPPGQEPTTAYISMVPQGGRAGGASSSPASGRAAPKTPSAGRGSGKP
ncbi:hypothetical protein tb265_16320 [Gemmatimonadetes bacterium T265]|nr:hypothetical protein tb265_16320 [Gemmatimonadetes bacterium T265]